MFRALVKVALLLVTIVAELSHFKDLVIHDAKIDIFRKQAATELNNPYYWAELGELYFDRYRRWKQAGLIESLECFTVANDLIISLDDDDTQSAQFAMTLQKGNGKCIFSITISYCIHVKQPYP